MKRMYILRMLILAVALLVLDSFNSVAQVSNFSGNWFLDNTASNLGGLAADIAAPKTIVVIIGRDSICVTKKFGDNEPIKQVLKFNDKAFEDIPEGNVLRLSSVKKDRKAIVFNWYYEMNGNEWRYQRTEKWVLSADSKTLTIDRITTMLDKVDSVKAVYRKQ